MKKIKFLLLFLLLLIGITSYCLLDYYGFLPHKTYSGEDFGISRAISPIDYNQNGIDDYTDILIGARMDAEARPKYKSAYYAGGYPPSNEGVCTDLVWRALKQAGYSLKDMVDQDIKENPKLYPGLDQVPDPNIDFRRVINLKVFFERKLVKLTNNLSQIEDWQPGDIVIFGEHHHVGIISDKRNKKGIPYLIHNSGEPFREADVLERWNHNYPITGHYRFMLKD